MKTINEIKKWVKENITKEFNPVVENENKIRIDINIFTDDMFEYSKTFEFKDLKDLEQKASKYLIKNNNYIRDSWWKNLHMNIDNGGESNEEFEMGYGGGEFWLQSFDENDYSKKATYTCSLASIWKFLDNKYGKGEWEEDWWIDFAMSNYDETFKTYMEYERAFKVLSTMEHLLEFFEIRSNDDDYNETYKLEGFEPAKFR